MKNSFLASCFEIWYEMSERLNSRTRYLFLRAIMAYSTVVGVPLHHRCFHEKVIITSSYVHNMVQGWIAWLVRGIATSDWFNNLFSVTCHLSWKQGFNCVVCLPSLFLWIEGGGGPSSNAVYHGMALKLRCWAFQSPITIQCSCCMLYCQLLQP